MSDKPVKTHSSGDREPVQLPGRSYTNQECTVVYNEPTAEVPSGDWVKKYTHIQDVPAEVWFVPHNMDGCGKITVYDENMVEVLPTIEVTINSAKITFGRPFTGIAVVHV